MKWISVKDRLPDVGQKTKCMIEFWRYKTLAFKKKMDAVYAGVCKPIDVPMWDVDTGDEAFAKVTHWMPLPDPPEAGDEKD